MPPPNSRVVYSLKTRGTRTLTTKPASGCLRVAPNPCTTSRTFHVFDTPPPRYGAMYSNGARKTNSIDGQKIVGGFSKVLVLLVTRRQQTRAGIQVHGVSSRPTSDCMHDRLRPSSICSKTPLVESFMFRVVLHNPNDTDEGTYAAIHSVHRRRFTRPLGDGVYETAQRGRRSKSNH